MYLWTSVCRGVIFCARAQRGALGLAAASVVGAGAAQAQSVAAVYVPGTYTATAKGYESDVTVTMTFSETAITDVQIDASSETVGIGSLVAEEMPQLILENQSVDVVTAATGTYTKSAIQKAGEDCIYQALIVKPAAGTSGLSFEPNEFGQSPVADAGIGHVQVA